MSVESDMEATGEIATFRKVVRSLVRYIFWLLGLLATLSYVLTMSNVWPYEKSDLGDKVWHTTYWIIILSVVGSTELAKVRNFIRKRLATGTAEP